MQFYYCVLFLRSCFLNLKKIIFEETVYKIKTFILFISYSAAIDYLHFNVPLDEFSSKKITNKLMQQVQVSWLKKYNDFRKYILGIEPHF